MTRVLGGEHPFDGQRAMPTVLGVVGGGNELITTVLEPSAWAYDFLATLRDTGE